MIWRQTVGKRAPFISVVVPTYGVAGYVGECLDSILAQGFEDFEVVAVDDQSPDRCGEILDEYAAADPRVRVVHLPENVGLGLARAEGLRASSGEYVWFVDSDDWLPDGALFAVANRLRRTGADMLLLDFQRVTPTGRTWRSNLRGFLPEASTPEVFTAAQQPGVFPMFPSAWSRVVRRDLLVEHAENLFANGWYEDAVFTLPLLIAARRITALRRVCYSYRQRPGGITTVTSARHFEVFDQYERVFALLSQWGVAPQDPVRGHLWSRMLEQYLWVLRGSSRVPGGMRRAFFRRARDHYRRWRPSDRPSITGSSRQRAFAMLERGLLAAGWYLAFEALVSARRLARWGRDRAKTVRRRLGRIRRRAWSAFGYAYYRLQTLRPLDPTLAIYLNYWGKSYGCNPAAVYEKAREIVPSVRGVWLMRRGCEKAVPSGVPYVVEGTLAYWRALARAKYQISNVSFPDYMIKRAGSVNLQTHHGTPLKAMGMDHRRYPIGAQGMDLEKLLQRARRWDLSVSTSTFNTEVWQRSYPVPHETLEVGYPRNDRLHLADADEVARVRAALGIEPGQTTILYIPTHREYQRGYAPTLDVDRLAEALGPGYRVLARLHHFYTSEFGRYADGHPGVLDVSDHGRVEDLYLAADMMITDYSSAMFDYGHLDRPIVIFASDWDAYRRVRGVNFDLMAEPPGAVATTFDELVAIFRTGAADDERAAGLRAAFRAKFCPHRHGRSAELVVRRTFRDALAVSVDAAPDTAGTLGRDPSAGTAESAAADQPVAAGRP